MLPLQAFERAPFIGRRAELSRLASHRASLDGFAERRRHIVVVEGPAGVGRTALVDEFLRELDRDDRTWTPRCAYAPRQVGPPLAPLLDAIDTLLSSGFARRRLLTLFSEPLYAPILFSLPLTAVVMGHDQIVERREPMDSETLATLAASVLSIAARFRPVVIMIDDIQWMRKGDSEGLATLNAVLRNDPVMIIGTRRTTAGHTDVADSENPYLLDTIRLHPLRPEEMAMLVTELYGPQVSALVAADLAHISTGIPFTALGILRRLYEQNHLSADTNGSWHITPGWARFVPNTTDATTHTSLPTGESANCMLAIIQLAGGLIPQSDLLACFAGINGVTRTQAAETLAEIDALGMVAIYPSDKTDVMLVIDAEEIMSTEAIPERIITALVAWIVATPEVRRSVALFVQDLRIIPAVISALPAVGSPERTEILNAILDTPSIYVRDEQNACRREQFMQILAGREHLTPHECARVLMEIGTVETIFSRFDDALAHAEELYNLCETDPACRELRAESCSRLALARFYRDRSINVSELLDRAERELRAIADPTFRMETEFQIAKARMTTVPVSQPHEAVLQSQRAFRIAEQIGGQQEKYAILCDLILRVSRLRDEVSLRHHCGELLRLLRSASHVDRPPLWVVASAVRAALNFGDIFLGRSLFAAWSRGTAPLEIREYVAHSYLITLFALSDGDPLAAAESALAARDEVLRLRSTSRNISYELIFNYSALQIYTISALISAGRYHQGLDVVGHLLDEADSIGSNLPDVILMLSFYRQWLLWRSGLSADAHISLAWLPVGDAVASMPRAMIAPITLVDTDERSTAFRDLYDAEIGAASLPVRVIVELLLAELEGAHGRFNTALEAVERAATACSTLYSWRNDVECRAARITLRLRTANVYSESSAATLDAAIEECRDLMGKMAERGMSVRLGQLTRLFSGEARRIAEPGRDLVSMFERMGSAAIATAHAVLANSVAPETGPIDATRLFIMGPLRLMRPNSFLEIPDSTFGRETARTLLTSLVCGRVMGRQPTRDDLVLQVAPKARTHEQQKKILYNAASSARSACGASQAIMITHSGSLALTVEQGRDGYVWVDAIEIQQLVERAAVLERDGAIGRAFDDYCAALALARGGEFASDCYADWVDAPRDRMREYLRDAAIAVGRIALRSGPHSRGIDALGLHLSRDPLDEEAHRLLVRLYADSGNRSAALRQLEKCSTLIRREFGVEPEEETIRLRDEIVSATTVSGISE